MPRLHRNNAAEWVMVIVLTPVAWIISGWKKRRERRIAAAAKTKKPVRSKVLIEGLPPRTMN
jgi:hypothetical protein